MDQTQVIYTPEKNDKNNKSNEQEPETKLPSDKPTDTPPPSDTSNGPLNQTPKSDLIDSIPLPKQPIGSGKTVTTATILAILFIGLGFVGGFLGFRYAPKLKSLVSTSADTNTPAIDSGITAPESTSATPGTIANWPIYNNTKYLYSVNYPDTWFNQNTNDPSAKSITLTSDNPSSKSSSNLEVTVTAQPSNGSDLKAWIETNNTVTNEKTNALSKLTLNGQDAYQQENTGVAKKIDTYLKQGDFILVMTYTADDSSFENGKAIYTQIIESIRLTTKP